MQMAHGPHLEKQWHARRPFQLEKRKDFLAVVTPKWDEMPQEAEFTTLEKFKQKPVTFVWMSWGEMEESDERLN